MSALPAYSYTLTHAQATAARGLMVAGLSLRQTAEVMKLPAQQIDRGLWDRLGTRR